ncbi:uncharacterized protein OCT59_028222 [Rhizophagus irregularis]|uniref:uncharacterized protein n=1 Tax=Rhizophagus irregularis TaxID=588596 RepID=UPI0033251DB1|nr:hypothetical protein OCT59_028222 [Rhizophagus irregularis]
MKSPEVAIKGNEAVCKTSEDCHQYWSKLTEHSAEHRANAEKRVMEFDTIIGQKWVDDLARESKRRRRETSPLEKYSNCDNVESLIEDDVGDENDYDKTDDEFDESKIERLVFENVCSPGKTKPPKYHRDHFVTRLILFVRDSGLTDKGMQKYLGNISESWRVCLADKDKCLAEKIFELEVPQKFEDDWVKLADIYKMMLLIERIFRHNDDVYHDYTKSAKKKEYRTCSKKNFRGNEIYCMGM